MVVIFVILTIAAFIAVDALVQRSRARARSASVLGAVEVGASVPRAAFANLTVPGGLFLNDNHTWLGLDATGKAKVGLDDFVRRVLGHIEHIELPKPGQEVKQGEELFAVRQGKRKAVFMAPIDGVVTGINTHLLAEPTAVETDPYRSGWVCTLSPRNVATGLRRLAIAEEARAWLNAEVQRFKEFMSSRPVPQPALGQVMQDGGQLAQGVLEFMDDDTWDLFNVEFLGSTAK
ncbi:MAG: hypothetical protein AB1898_13860 [Acidobacteriota bacterium]